MKTLRFLLGTAICALAVLPGAFAAAAESFPSAPVKIIVGVGPGSSPDVLSRLIADHLSRLWRQQVIVLNQPGAGGAISIRAAGNATPDGHTLFVSLASNYVLLPQTQANLPFDVARDFVPIGFVGEHPMVIAASAALGVSTLAELSALASKRPGDLNIAAGNHGSILHLTAEWLRTATGSDLTIVNYPALPQALADLIGGRIHLMVEALSGLGGVIGAGKVKALAVASAQRLPDRPDIPATAELLPGFVASGWLALVAPPKTPEAIARIVSADLRKVLAQPEVRERLQELGTYARPMSPAELAGFIRGQQAIWKPVIEQVGLKSPQ
jgi:tripartite-type tricarboxylate transporter receptor subunit TctC